MSKIIDTVEEFWDYEDLEKAISTANKDSGQEFIFSLARYFDIQDSQIYIRDSGSKALEVILRSIGNNRNEVLMPVWSCIEVLKVINKLGLKVRFYDFSYEPLSLDDDYLKNKINSNSKALIINHYFGVPSDILELRNQCNKKGIVLIEDCAHCMGAFINSQIVGTIGHCAFFSFNYDKPISLAGSGGAAIFNESSCFNLSEIKNENNFYISKDDEIKQITGFLEYLENRRNIKNYINRNLLKNKFNYFKNKFFKNKSIEFYGNFGIVRSNLGVFSLLNYSKFLDIRNKNASYLNKNIDYHLFNVYKGNIQPAFLKFKIIVYANKWERKKFIRFCLENTLRVGNYNWSYLLDKNYSKYPNSYRLMKYGFELPIHHNMSKANLDIIIKGIRSIKLKN